MNFSKRIYLYLFAALFVFSSVWVAGCDLIDGSDDPDIKAKITVQSVTPPVGVPVELDAGESVYEGRNPEFTWSLEAPSGSNAVIAAPNSEKTSFYPDMTGDYLVTLRVKAEGVEDSQTLTLVVGGGDVPISSDITNDFTFFSENRYLITQSITLRDARLIIQPGTEIRFDQGTGFTVGSDGIIVADGTDDEPILFTGTQKTRGWWDGVFFSGTTHPHNLLNHVIIEYGGREQQHSSTRPANLTLSRSISGNIASVTITNSTFRNSAGYGLFLHENGRMPESFNNTYTKNATGAAAVDAASLHYLDAESTYSGNDQDSDFVLVLGNSISSGVAWQALDVPCFVQGEISVSSSDFAEFRIHPGAAFHFDTDGGFIIRENVILALAGTEENPILFTGSEKTPGWWKGIYVIETTHPNNLIEHIIVEYAGKEAFHGSTEPANLTIARDITRNEASVTIKNSTFRHGHGYGLFLHNNGRMPDSKENRYSHNRQGAVGTFTNVAHYFDAGSDYSGNEKDYVWIRGNTLSQSADWQALNVPYGMKGVSTVRGEIDFVIKPGATFKFDAFAGLVLDDGIKLTIAGTASSPILFTAIQETPGWWKGIHILGTLHVNNNVEHIIVEYGGHEAWHSSLEKANLSIGRSISRNNARVTIKDSHFRFSNGQGLHVHSGSEVNADVCVVNVFQGNTADGCVVVE